MSGINFGRWIAGGLTAGVLIWIAEIAGSTIYINDMQKIMAEHNLKMEMNFAAFAFGISVSLISSLVQVFFYAAARQIWPRA